MFLVGSFYLFTSGRIKRVESRVEARTDGRTRAQDLPILLPRAPHARQGQHQPVSHFDMAGKLRKKRDRDSNKNEKNERKEISLKTSVENFLGGLSRNEKDNFFDEQAVDPTFSLAMKFF